MISERECLVNLYGRISVGTSTYPKCFRVRVGGVAFRLEGTPLLRRWFNEVRSKVIGNRGDSRRKLALWQ